MSNDQPITDLQKDVNAFNDYLKERYSGVHSATGLSPLYIPDAVWPLKTQGADLGISADAVGEGVDGLPVVIGAYSKMQVTDVVKVYWNDDLVWTHKVRAGQNGKHLTLNLPSKDIPTGITELYYSVSRDGEKAEEQSTRLNVLFRANYPGESAEHDDALAAPLVSHQRIDADSKNVKVSIPTYTKMRRYDRIHLSWSGHMLEHEVSGSEVGKTVIIDIPEAVVEAASSAVLAVSYYVVDEVGNESFDWSACQEIANGLATGEPAPFVVDPQTLKSLAQVKSGGPGSAGLTVEIDPPPEGFPLDSSIHALWTTRNAQGESQVVDLGSQTVVRSRRTLVFNVPAEYFATIWGGSGTASYECVYGGQTLTSKRTHVEFVGAPAKLAPPLLDNVSEGYLEADLQLLTVVIPASVQLQVDDTVTLTWRGTRPDGTLLLEKPTALRIGSAQAGQDAIFEINGEALLAPLDGGALEITYTVIRGSVQLVSEPALFDIGDALETLPPPILDPEPTHAVVDPSSPQYSAGVEAVVPLNKELALPYEVEIEWSLSNGESYFDTQRVTEANVTQIRFQIPRAQLESALTQTLTGTLYYRIIQSGAPDLISYDLDMVLGRQPRLDLPAPIVEELGEDTLDPTGLIHGATVTIPALADLAAGDKVVLYWSGDQPHSVAEVEDSVCRGEEGQSRTLPIDLSLVLASENGEVDLRYEVVRFRHKQPSDWSTLIRFRVQRGALPLPVIAQAVQGNINPLETTEQATVVIAAVAKLAAGDEVVLRVTGLATHQVDTITYRILAEDVGQSLSIKVPSSLIVANLDKGLKIDYSIKRFNSRVVEQSAEQTYSISHVMSSAPLRVMGARYNVDGRTDITVPRRLTAVDAATSKPIMAGWRYSGDTDWVLSQSWRDTQPKRLLEVRTQATSVVLNIANLVGCHLGFFGMLDTTTPGVYTLRSWGSVAAAPAGIDNVTDLSFTSSAVAAKRVDGSIRCWGDATAGGAMRPNDIQRRDFLTVCSNHRAFVALYGSSAGERRLTGWGNASNGATIPQDILDLRDIDTVVSSIYAFAALRSNGSLVAWGAEACGGVLPNPYRAFDDVVEIQGGGSGFVARRVTSSGQKQVFVWGGASLVNNVPSSISQRDDIESVEAHGTNAYCLLTTQGQVLAFGDANNGGQVPAKIARLTDIVEVTSTLYAFCARRKNGHVVAWGLKSSGGDLPADIARRADVVQVTATSSAFAALFADGSVRCWGNAANGGNANALAGQLVKVRAIYGTYYSFSALTDDGRVLSWGNGNYGGNNLRQQPHVAQKVRVQRD